MENCFANWQLILEYLKVLLAWPPLVAGFLLLAVWLFRNQIGELIDRVRSVEAFGGKFDASPLAEAQDAAKVQPAPTATSASKTPLESISSDPAKAQAEILKWWSIAQYESVFNRIFGTQMRLLAALTNKIATGESMANLLPFYSEHQKLAATIASPMGSYFAFLTAQNLIRIEGVDPETQMVFLTDHGSGFLRYITTTYGTSASVRAW